MSDRFLKRLSKKAKKGMRGWPVATVAFYGPDASRASKVVVGIVASEHEAVGAMRDWKLEVGDVRNDSRIVEEILDFITGQGVLSVAMTDRIIGCPHQEGIDYEGQWCPVCEYWKARDRFTGERVESGA